MSKGRPKKAKGLGDTIEQITEATGIKKLVHFIAGEDCGCDERKEFLNKLFPYKKPKCLIEDDYNYLSELFAKNLNQLSVNQQYKLIDIYKNVFDIKLEHSNCSSCWRDIVNELKKVYDSYANS